MDIISPAGDFQADGARTGKYILGGEELVLNSKGESVISYADYAIARLMSLSKEITFSRESALLQNKLGKKRGIVRVF